MTTESTPPTANIPTKTRLTNCEEFPIAHNQELERKLKDTVELLHLWKNETYAYRFLVEAVITGRYSKEHAQQALTNNELRTTKLNTVYLQLSPTEQQALAQVAKQTNLPPHQLLWTALDSLMNVSSQDPQASPLARYKRRPRRPKRLPTSRPTKI